MNKDTILSYYNFSALSNDIIELASEILLDKVIYINFLNDDVQVTMKVSKHDTNVNIIEGETIPAENAICNTIDYKSVKPLVLENAKVNNFNEKVKQTVENNNIGSYLGIPIMFKNGQRFGTLCAAHHDSSVFDDNDVALLEKISNLFSYYLELERQANVDSLTGIENKRFLTLKEDEITQNGGTVIMLDLDNFKDVNDHLGHHSGNLILIESAKKLKDNLENFNDYYTIRLGGDEFFIYIADDLNNEEVMKLLDILNNEFKTWNSELKNINLSASFGAYKFKANSINKFENLYKKVDEILYEAKNKGKSNFAFNYMK